MYGLAGSFVIVKNIKIAHRRSSTSERHRHFNCNQIGSIVSRAQLTAVRSHLQSHRYGASSSQSSSRLRQRKLGNQGNVLAGSRSA
jgi:hypothetical protein